MILTEKEQKIINKNRSFSDACEYLFLDIYFKDSITEDFETICSLIKKVILEEISENGFEVDSNIKFNIDEILNTIFKDDQKELPNFDITYIKNFDLLNSYFDSLIKSTKTSKEIEKYSVIFRFFNIKAFLSKYVKDILNNMESQNYRFLDKEYGDYSMFDDFNINSEKGEEYNFDEFKILTEEEKEEIKKKNEKLIEFLKFMNTIPELMNYRFNYEKELNILQLKGRQKKLEEFYSNKEFMENFSKIMEHDRNHKYWFHGTTCLEDAYSISEQGLGLMRDDISSTAYSEFTMEDVILYSRGFGGEIGSDAIVVIDMPKIDKEWQNIVEKKSDDVDINFSPSGLQGLNGKPNYIIDKKYIVGIIDKKNKKIIFNPNYYSYKKYEMPEKINSNLIDNNKENKTNIKHM